MEEETTAETVYTINESDIRPHSTQCAKHTWVKVSENEIGCTKCPTVNIIDPNKMKQYVSK